MAKAPKGTSNYKLYRSIMMHLADCLGLCLCHRCGKRIESLREFSVEHKIPWIGHPNAAAVFTDLSNIAFSHLSCNSRAQRRSNKIYADKFERGRASHKRYWQKHGPERNARRRPLRRKNSKHNRVELEPEEPSVWGGEVRGQYTAP